MSREEIVTGATAAGRTVPTLLYGSLLILSVVVVAAQVRLSGITAAALAFALTGALFTGWAECRASWIRLRRALIAPTRTALNRPRRGMAHLPTEAAAPRREH
ncbi:MULTISPECIES: hypothetical protein [Saccharothrix]|uniref:hypothetical protein n=1 Tax=Saccharothrix TaxID=2071 RepID=UPI00130172D0|nr:hypothetical protein [Saccharothrix sp. CB00851]